jgi:hypothetical protein
MSSTIATGILTSFLSTVNTSNFTMTVPAGQQIIAIQLRETANNAITGGLKIGTTDGGTDVVTAQAVGALGNLVIADAAILLKVFSISVDTTLYLQAVVAWNNASLNVAMLTGPAA